jgi:3-phenylpropionate/trans-cinnamate dioxygenase ferredoxin subunit
LLHRVCHLDELSQDAPYGFTVDGLKIVLVRKGDVVYALDGICTHEYAELDKGFVVGDLLVCPLHLSQFDVKTGAVVTPPAEIPLRTYTVQIKGGEVYVEV